MPLVPQTMHPGHVREHPALTGGTVAVIANNHPSYPVSLKQNVADKLDEMGINYEKTSSPLGEAYILINPHIGQALSVGKMLGQESILWSNGGKNQIFYVNGDKEGTATAPQEGFNFYSSVPTGKPYFAIPSHSGEPWGYVEYKIDGQNFVPFNEYGKTKELSKSLAGIQNNIFFLEWAKSIQEWNNKILDLRSKETAMKKNEDEIKRKMPVNELSLKIRNSKGDSVSHTKPYGSIYDDIYRLQKAESKEDSETSSHAPPESKGKAPTVPEKSKKDKSDEAKEGGKHNNGHEHVFTEAIKPTSCPICGSDSFHVGVWVCNKCDGIYAIKNHHHEQYQHSQKPIELSKKEKADLLEEDRKMQLNKDEQNPKWEVKVKESLPTPGSGGKTTKGQKITEKSNDGAKSVDFNIKSGAPKTMQHAGPAQTLSDTKCSCNKKSCKTCNSKLNKASLGEVSAKNTAGTPGNAPKFNPMGAGLQINSSPLNATSTQSTNRPPPKTIAGPKMPKVPQASPTMKLNEPLGKATAPFSKEIKNAALDDAYHAHQASQNAEAPKEVPVPAPVPAPTTAKPVKEPESQFTPQQLIGNTSIKPRDIIAVLKNKSSANRNIDPSELGERGPDLELDVPKSKPNDIMSVLKNKTNSNNAVKPKTIKTIPFFFKKKQ